MPAYERILGINFFTGSAEEAAQIGAQGGLVVVPSAPALMEMQTNEQYREAALNADLVITDSAYMVLLWFVMTGKKLQRVSGLKYLRILFEMGALRESVLWIMPNVAARDQNLKWLKSQGYNFTEADCYLAPHYPEGPVLDEALLKMVNGRKPKQIVVGLGGGTQEKIGMMLKRELQFKTGIHCIGGALGFVAGYQVNIPNWGDKFYLGWLFRCLSEPKKFVPRYWKSSKLAPMMIRYREKLPDLLASKSAA
jgi:UDP-N-acetyl-D-mannosaminuronic acid transferase (WecB/TagA/CpsF family)